jgi:hypothetical protein
LSIDHINVQGGDPLELFKMFGEVALEVSKTVGNQLKVIDLAAARTARGLEAIPDKVETEVDIDTDKAENKIGELLSLRGSGFVLIS